MATLPSISHSLRMFQMLSIVGERHGQIVELSRAYCQQLHAE